MAAASIGGSFGKRLASLIRDASATRSPAAARAAAPAASAVVLRRGVHSSHYDKNVEDHERPVIVPDNVIDSNTEQYWAPHPITGIFVPSHAVAAGHFSGSTGVDDTGSSVLNQKVWYRPLEDIDHITHKN